MNKPSHEFNCSVWVKAVRKANALNVVFINPIKDNFLSALCFNSFHRMLNVLW